MRLSLLPLSIVLKSLPDTVHAELLSRLFNHLLKGQYLSEQLLDLEGRRLAINISDTRSEIIFAIRNGQLQRAQGRQWDARIRGRLAEFWLLATRSEDPDTLFFARRLDIEGDTATGLHIKNLLDGMDFDWQAHAEAVAGPRLAPLLLRAVHQIRYRPRLPSLLPRLN